VSAHATSPHERLRVLVDATMLDGLPSGAATRLAALGAAHAARGVVEVLHLVRPGVEPLPGLRCVPFGGAHTPLRRALAGRRLDAALRAHGAALLQCGALPLANVRAAPQLLTVHDLRLVQPDDDLPRARRLWAARRLLPNLARAAALVAVSESTAAGLRAALGERAAPGVHEPPRVPVHVVPNAGTPGLQTAVDPARIADFRRRLQWNARYVLAIGPLERHKRPLLLLDALAVARARDGGGDLGLVIAGRVEPARARTFGEHARARGLHEVVRLTGPLDEALLSAALCGADALAIASTCEGFAIPVVDAQRCGVPVVAVAAGALPEVAGEGGWLVPPGDAAALGAALVDAVTPGQERDRRLARARGDAERWSWERSAAALEALWAQAVSAAR
jgi:glycosyltransferase involved in cell wall biosynthesis